MMTPFEIVQNFGNYIETRGCLLSGNFKFQDNLGKGFNPKVDSENQMLIDYEIISNECSINMSGQSKIYYDGIFMPIIYLLIILISTWLCVVSTYYIF